MTVADDATRMLCAGDSGQLASEGVATTIPPGKPSQKEDDGGGDGDDGDDGRRSDRDRCTRTCESTS